MLLGALAGGDGDEEPLSSWVCRGCLASTRAGRACFQGGTKNPLMEVDGYTSSEEASADISGAEDLGTTAAAWASAY